MINKLELSAVLEKAAPFLMAKSFAPILTHFCFNGSTVIAFNDLQAIEVKYKSELNCALPGALLSKLINSLQNNALEVIQKMDEIQFTSGKTKIKVPTLPSEDFIFEMPSVEDCQEIRVPLDVISGLANCLISTSNDLANPEKSGVRLIIHDKILEFYSSDSVSLSKFVYNSPDVPDCVIDIIIPSAFCEQLIRLTKTKASDVEETAFVNIFISPDDEDTFLIAEIDANITIFTRLIEVEEKIYYDEIINSFETQLSCWNAIPKELENIIDRACILVAPEESYITSFECKDKNIFIETTSKSGKSDDVLSFETTLVNGKFRINPEVIKRILGSMTQFAFSFTNPIIAFKGCNGNFLHFAAVKDLEF